MLIRIENATKEVANNKNVRKGIKYMEVNREDGIVESYNITLDSENGFTIRTAIVLHMPMLYISLLDIHGNSYTDISIPLTCFSKIALI